GPLSSGVREHSHGARARHIPKAISGDPMKSTKPSPVARSHLLVAQWSRSIGELVRACGETGFEAALRRALGRLVEFDFVMVFAYRGAERPLALGDTLDAELRRVLIDEIGRAHV